MRLRIHRPFPTGFLFYFIPIIYTIFTPGIYLPGVSAQNGRLTYYSLFWLYSYTKRNYRRLSHTWPVSNCGICSDYMYFLPRRNFLFPSIPVPHNLNTTYDYGFLRGIAGFVTGMIMYKLYQRPSVKNVFHKDILAGGIILLLVLALHFAVNDAFCIILFAVLI